LNFLYTFSKEKKTQISNFIKRIPSWGAELFHAEGLMDRHDEDNRSFSEFCERAFTVISFITTMRLPNLQLLCRLYFLAKHHITQVCQPPLQPRFSSLRLLAFPKAKIAVERVEICEFDGHTVHKLCQQRLTAD